MFGLGLSPRGRAPGGGTLLPDSNHRGAASFPALGRAGARLTPPSAQVELLVMKALSVGLVKGSIDEVDERVHMTWVQPRVLDLQQVTRAVGRRRAPGRAPAAGQGFREPRSVPPGT